jgi:hypothetical protein
MSQGHRSLSSSRLYDPQQDSLRALGSARAVYGRTNSGTLNEKFLNSIMTPGVFSSFTALDRYIDACLTLPESPPQLHNTYSTPAENIAGIVGCTVTPNRDPQTGGF